MEGSIADDLYSESLKLADMKLQDKSGDNLELTDVHDYSGADFWHEDGSEGDDLGSKLDNLSDLDREWQRRHDQFHTIGYRDGLIAGKEASAQDGFSLGFKESVLAGHNWGLVKGITSALALLPDGLKVKMVETQQTKDEFQELYTSVHTVSTIDAMKLFHNNSLSKQRVDQDEMAGYSSTQITTSQPQTLDVDPLGICISKLTSLLCKCPAIEVELKV